MLADVTSELRFAQTFLERSTNAVEFTVADRDDDTNQHKCNHDARNDNQSGV